MTGVRRDLGSSLILLSVASAMRPDRVALSSQPLAASSGGGHITTLGPCSTAEPSSWWEEGETFLPAPYLSESLLFQHMRLTSCFPAVHNCEANNSTSLIFS